jgi:hypothetical protein
MKFYLRIYSHLGSNAQPQSQSYFTTGSLAKISSSWRRAPWDSRPVFFFQLNTFIHVPYVISSLTRGWVCRLQLLLALASAVILRSESRLTYYHILVSQIRDSSNLEDQVPVFISPRKRVAQFYPQALGSLCVASYDSQGHGGSVRCSLHADFTGYMFIGATFYVQCTFYLKPYGCRDNYAKKWASAPQLFCNADCS